MAALDHIGIFVRNLDEARPFYESLGLTLVDRSEDHAFRIWTFRSDAVEVHLFEPKEALASDSPRIDHIALRVSDEELDARIADLHARGIAFSGPHAFEGRRFVKVEDPDGTSWEWIA